MKVDLRNKTNFEVYDESFNELLEWLNRRDTSESSVLSVALVADDQMKRLHEDYYGESGTTDVLTFNYEDDTLEIVLNPFQQERQAPEADNTFNEEVAENLLHGYLHGQDYDHTHDDGEHLRRQNKLMDDLPNRFFPLVERPAQEVES